MRISRRAAAAAAAVLWLAANVKWPAPVLSAAPPCATVLDGLTRTATLATAAEAFRAAGLAESLAGARTVTVFAPDAQAFSKFPRMQLRIALANRHIIAPIGAYHIVPGEVSPDELRRVHTLPTVNGKPLEVSVVNGAVVLDGRATVEGAPLRCGNGMVYVINAVLRP